ncbi:hypothetical protein LTR99_007371 [Exophiala xenobiotica]|uniref:Hexosyltransferase n=1 Tax=Vermiconidia calcicola TaxID=1690605 RepID=A0AAV9Q2G7_9PEZI|nr:hypothetical protein LTR96_008009 [Exophiala xenobiotica]KAK5534480.1 hypothetical protein LTR25_006512 [Vermiconidia calcicola]KAK5299103.1 hypothetical protein LTR99_007371 [Exophiala xenobiotica]KAK5334789.1 hypothetical protein LTR98_009162 [Exophiala xenobiotica]KAK5429471.1 hypothetical protein LTR34_007067 [Exophiala xenobiotica]
MYNNDAFTMRFVISNPGATWEKLVQHENETYGDLIIMSNLEESRTVANTIKTMEFFSSLAHGTSTWKYVSKVDDDSFVNTEAFYQEYLEPRLDATRTIIARSMKDSHRDYSYPQGQFYTVSWDMVLTLSELYAQNHITDEHEDALVGRLLYEGGHHYDLIEVPNERFHDYGPDNKAWTYLDTHAITNETISPHLLKDDETYLEVARQMEELKSQGKSVGALIWMTAKKVKDTHRKKITDLDTEFQTNSTTT